MFKNLKLRTKIVGAIFLSSVVLSILITLATYFYLNNSLVKEKIENIGRLNIEQTHESIQIFKKFQLFTKTIGDNILVKDYLLKPTEVKRLELLQVLSDYSKEDEKYLSLYLLDRSGVALVSSDQTFTGQDYSFRDYYKNGLQGKPVVTFLLGKTTNEFGYYFSSPVFDTNQKVIGVLVVKVDAQAINSAIEESQAAQQNTVMLVDDYGVIITSNQSGRFLKSLGRLSDAQKLAIEDSKKFLDQEILPLQYDNIQKIINQGIVTQSIKINDSVDGETEIFDVNKIGEFPFYLVSENGLESVGEKVNYTILILIGLVILAIIVVSFFMYGLILKTISPLWQLKSFAEDISAGDFSKKINIKSKDVFGNLAEAFNSMAYNLEKKFKDKNKNLEKSELAAKQALVEAERLNKIMVGREIEMIRLKKELADLKNKS